MSDWELLIAQARASGLLGTLAHRQAALGPATGIPSAALDHLTGARLVSAAQRAEVLRELKHIRNALAGYNGPVVLLKGAAYAAAGLPAADGRMFSDTDILVPRARLPEVESALMQHGWVGTHNNAYDQRYYREWMHELPPMEHVRRLTVIDVHHNIAPLTARSTVDAQKLLAAARPLPDDDRYLLLAPADMVLHSMLHLTRNEEFSRGLRDLADIDQLLRAFAVQPAFWDELVERAHELGLQRTLYYGLSCSRAILATPLPLAIAQRVARVGAPPPLQRQIMGHLWYRVLRPPHPSTADGLSSAAERAMYVRAHWLRMPTALLVRHLMAKARRPDRLGTRVELALPGPHHPGG